MRTWALGNDIKMGSFAYHPGWLSASQAGRKPVGRVATIGTYPTARQRFHSTRPRRIVRECSAPPDHHGTDRDHVRGVKEFGHYCNSRVIKGAPQIRYNQSFISTRRRGDAEVDFRALFRALRASAGKQNVTSQAKKV